MDTDWEIRLQKKIQEFYTELDTVCHASGRKIDEVQVLFATKYLNKDEFNIFVHSVISLNTRKVLIGENRVQDAEEKFSFARRDLANTRKILIGNLQKNKINKAIGLFDEIHSIDSVGLARELNKRLEKVGKTMPVFLEINVSGEKTKHGIKVEEVDKVVKVIKGLNFIILKGLMTMAPFTNDQKIIRNVFRKLKTLADQHQLKTSMGMSHDWKIAVEQGSDIIRIGSKIFGYP